MHTHTHTPLTLLILFCIYWCSVYPIRSTTISNQTKQGFVCMCVAPIIRCEVVETFRKINKTILVKHWLNGAIRTISNFGWKLSHEARKRKMYMANLIVYRYRDGISKRPPIVWNLCDRGCLKWGGMGAFLALLFPHTYFILSLSFSLSIDKFLALFLSISIFYNTSSA